MNLAPELADRLGARRASQEWRTNCPLHDNEHPSLNFRDGDKGIVFTCRSAGCDSAAIPEQRAERLADVDRLVAELEALPVVVAPRLVADDITPEKVAVLMAQHGERIALLSAEGGVFGIMAGRYQPNSSPNLDVFLKAHSGDRLTVDRIGRSPVRLEKPALTIGLAVQPDVIRRLADTPEFRGRGLLARFLYALPDSLVGSRDQPAAGPQTRRAGCGG